MMTNLFRSIIAVSSLVIAGLLIWILVGQSFFPQFAPNRSFQYPVNMEVHTALESEDDLVRVIHNVSYSKEKELYRYKYTILSDKDVVFTWTVLDVLTGRGSPLLFKLQAGIPQEITLFSSSAPVIHYGDAWIYKLEKVENEEETFSSRYAYLVPTPISAQPAPVPGSLLEK